jgi:hypothetical protein
MQIHKVKIKSAITPWVWYYDKVGQVFEGVDHFTESLFWFPGKVYKTPMGYIHDLDAIVLETYESPVEPLQNN